MPTKYVILRRHPDDTAYYSLGSQPSESTDKEAVYALAKKLSDEAREDGGWADCYYVATLEQV